jgi:2-phosphosulfolactate phosphatase
MSGNEVRRRHLDISYATLDTCGEARGTVVVIDVIRAFTTAAYAFAAGAEEIVLVSTVQEALTLRHTLPGALVMGEFDGLPVPGFDFDNSPAAIAGRHLAGCRLVQRTSAGTQGVVRSTKASVLLASSFVTAGATAQYLRLHTGSGVTFVVTGKQRVLDGEEDLACAKYIASLLRDEAPDAAPYLLRASRSRAARNMTRWTAPRHLKADVQCCLRVDAFDFAMVVERQDGLRCMRPVRLAEQDSSETTAAVAGLPSA